MSTGRIKKLTRKVLKDRQKIWAKEHGSEERQQVLPFSRWPETWKEKFLAVKTIGAYMPLSDELDFSYVLEYLASEGKTICFPKVEGDDMSFYEALPSECRTKGRFGILEPSSSGSVLPSQIDLLIVPAMAYALDGTRLGRGKGFYDRFCCRDGKNQADRFSGKILGVVPERCLLGSLPSDTWDLKVDSIVTEDRWIDVIR